MSTMVRMTTSVAPKLRAVGAWEESNNIVRFPELATIMDFRQQSVALLMPRTRWPVMRCW